MSEKDRLAVSMERVTALGCCTLLACVVLSCALSSIFRPSDISVMESCAQACGPGRMERYSIRECQCIDGPGRIDQPMIPIDAGAR